MHVNETKLAVGFALFTLCFLRSGQSHAEDVPRLEWGKPVQCYTTAEGENVRVQCGEPDSQGKRTCLVAPSKVKHFQQEVTHVQDCETTGVADDYQRLVNSGSQLVPALAEVPPGYARDNYGRAFQVQFDLLKRVYIGASWLPTMQLGDSTNHSRSTSPIGRAQLETGTIISIQSPRGRSRHDIRLIEGSAGLDDFELRGQLFR